MNDVQLYGKSRREVVSFLKEVPPPFTLVCCRHPIADLEPESESEPEPVLRLQPKAGPARQSQRGVEEVRTGLFMVPWDGICSNNYFLSSYDRKDEKHHCLV